MVASERSANPLDHAAQSLSRLFACCRVWPDGNVVEIKEQVARIGGVTIKVFSKEHAPPHFHVEYSGKQASFKIENCDRLEGNLSSNEANIVRYWFKGGGKSNLIDAWNRTRPGDCSVGKYGDAASA